MKLLKDRGFSLIEIQEHWLNNEPEEGRYDFGSIEELVAHASALDLGVYRGLTAEQAPA